MSKIGVNVTKAELEHAVEATENVTQAELKHAVEATENVTKAELEHVVEATENVTKEELKHAVEAIENVTKEELEHAVEATENITQAELEHAVEATENINAAKYKVAIGVGTVANENIDAYNADGIAIGYGAKADENDATGQSIAVGKQATADNEGIAIGPNSEVTIQHGIAIGHSAESNATRSVAIGYLATSEGQDAVQLGYGTNSEANTFKFGSVTNGETTIVNSNGKIPASSIETNKFNPKLVAGTNITLTNNQDGTQTIASQGGGGGGTSDYTDLTNKPQINDVTLSGNKTSSDLGLQNKLTAGTGIQIVNDVIAANGRPIKFVQSLPVSNIDTTAVYNISNDSIFPEVASWAGASNDCVIVTYDANNGYKLLWLESNRTGDNFKYTNYYGETRNYHYKIFHAGNTSWVEDINSTGTDYMTAFGIVWNTVIYSNYNIRNGDGSGDSSGVLRYSKSNNQTDIYGVPLNGTATYLFRTYQYINNAWALLGISDYSELFNEVLAKLAALQSGKQDTLLTFSNITVATTDFIGDSTYSDYPYKAILRCPGVTSSMQANVYLSTATAMLGVVATPVLEGTDSVAIYCKQNDIALTIDKVVVF